MPGPLGALALTCAHNSYVVYLVIFFVARLGLGRLIGVRLSAFEVCLGEIITGTAVARRNLWQYSMTVR